MGIKILRTASGCMASISLIRELDNRGIEVICADAEPLSVGLFYCKKGYVIPKGDDPNFVPEILKICKKEGIKAIISGPEEEITAISKNKNIFLKEGILPIVPDYDTVKICADKIKTYEFFIKHGIPTPKTFELNDLKLQEDEMKYPIIIKPRFGRGSSGIYIIRDEKDFKHFNREYTLNYIGQEYIEGIECTIDVFSDMDGNVLSIVPRKRLTVESGIAVKSETFYDRDLIEYTYKIAEKLNIKGPANIQCIMSEKNSCFMFTEINTRFGGGSILSIKADPTIIKNLIRIIKRQETLPSNGFKRGLLMLRYYQEIYVEK